MGPTAREPREPDDVTLGEIYRQQLTMSLMITNLTREVHAALGQAAILEVHRVQHAAEILELRLDTKAMTQRAAAIAGAIAAVGALVTWLIAWFGTR